MLIWEWICSARKLNKNTVAIVCHRGCDYCGLIIKPLGKYFILETFTSGILTEYQRAELASRMADYLNKLSAKGDLKILELNMRYNVYRTQDGKHVITAGKKSNIIVIRAKDLDEWIDFILELYKEAKYPKHALMAPRNIESESIMLPSINNNMEQRAKAKKVKRKSLKKAFEETWENVEKSFKIAENTI